MKIRVVVNTPITEIEPTTKSVGLGDVIASVAQPIAKAVDFVAKTNLANCAPCAKRKQGGNETVRIEFGETK